MPLGTWKNHVEAKGFLDATKMKMKHSMFGPFTIPGMVQNDVFPVAAASFSSDFLVKVFFFLNDRLLQLV